MKTRSHCPINYTLEHFGDKWSLLILRDLMFKEKRHYNEFLESDEKVSTSVLGDRLKMLEENEIITKGEDKVKKSRIKYPVSFKKYKHLLDQLGKYKTSVSCLYINKLEDIDLSVLETLISKSVDDMRAKYENKD